MDDHLVMWREIPMVAIMKGDPDVPAAIFLVDDPPAFQLNLAKVVGLLIVQDEIDPAVIDRKESIEPVAQRQRDERIAVDDFGDLGAISAHDPRLPNRARRVKRRPIPRPTAARPGLARGRRLKSGSGCAGRGWSIRRGARRSASCRARRPGDRQRLARPC